MSTWSSAVPARGSESTGNAAAVSCGFRCCLSPDRENQNEYSPACCHLPREATTCSSVLQDAVACTPLRWRQAGLYSKKPQCHSERTSALHARKEDHLLWQRETQNPKKNTMRYYLRGKLWKVSLKDCLAC